MLRAIVKLANSEPGLMVDGRTAGLRIPFGARNSGASEILREYAAELTEAIIDRAFAENYLARRLCGPPCVWTWIGTHRADPPSSRTSERPRQKITSWTDSVRSS